MRRLASICAGPWPHSASDRVGGALTQSDDTEAAWIERARRLTAFECEVTFGLQSSFYIGPANDFTAADWQAAHLPLPPVDLPRRFADRITTTELLGQEAPLIDYYRQVVSLAERHGKRSSLRPFPYFRTEPAVIADGAVLTELPWNDDVNDTWGLLTAFVEAGTGPDRLIHCDVGQGWEILVVTKAAATCWIEWDAEGPPPAEGGFAADREELAQLAQAALIRMRTLHARLIDALGHDYWTYRPPEAPTPARVADRVRRLLGSLFRRPSRR